MVDAALPSALVLSFSHCAGGLDPRLAVGLGDLGGALETGCSPSLCPRRGSKASPPLSLLPSSHKAGPSAGGLFCSLLVCKTGIIKPAQVPL